MSNEYDPNPVPPSVYATILLAFICSIFCSGIIIILVLINWQNPIWDGKVRAIAVTAVLAAIGVTVFIGWLLKKRMRK